MPRVRGAQSPRDKTKPAHAGCSRRWRGGAVGIRFNPFVRFAAGVR
jgi:hypothetical protein